MPSARRIAISKILTDATFKLGENEIYKLSAMRPPVFDQVTAEEFYQQSVASVRDLQTRYKEKINK
jgi:hypothetical protein